MKKKRFIQSVELGGSIYGKKRSTGKNVSPNHRSVSKKDIMSVYDKFYKNQAAALYKAINKDN